jgi:Ca2+-binding RTX toxin-like protein
MSNTNTLISDDQLRAALDQIASKIGNGHIYLGIEACESGAFVSEFSNSPYQNAYTVFTGTGPLELGWADGHLQNGVFTYFFGNNAIFNGQGDINGDGLVTTGELYQSVYGNAYDYVWNHVNDNGLPVTMTPQRYDGSDGNAVMASYDGNDVLNGGNGNDILNGGAGNDLLIGGSNDDIYIYGSSDGEDIIENYTVGEIDGFDIVQFTDGITSAALDIRRWGNDLVLFMQDSQFDALTISDWFMNDFYQVDQFKFADGTIWSSNDMTNAANGNSAVIIDGTDLLGGVGNDILVSDDDVVRTMTGGAGDDIYLWGAAGNDTIINSTNGTDMGDDVAQLACALDDIVWFQEGSDLVLAVDSHTLTFQNWFIDSAYQVDTVSFADGSVLTNTKINEFLQG